MFSNLRRTLKIVFFVTMGIYTFVWLFSPWVANYYLSQYLETQNLSLSDETSIRYNPFRSRLEINALNVNNANTEQVLSLSFLSFEMHLHQLIFEDVYIPQVRIKGLDLTIETLQDDVVVAGISLLLSADANLAGSAESTSESTSESTGNGSELSFLKRFIMPKLLLEDSNVHLGFGENSHQLSIHQIEIVDLLATSQKQVVNISLNSELDNRPVEITVNVDFLETHRNIDFDVNISNVDVNRFSHLLPQDIDSLNGLVSYQGQHRLKMQDDSIILNVQTGRLTGTGVNVGKEGAHIEIGQQDINLEGLVVVLEKNKKPRITGNSSILINEFTIYNKERSEVLTDVKQIKISSVAFSDGEQGTQQINVGQVDLVDAFFSDSQADPVPALVKFASLKIQDVGLSQYGIEIGDISLAGLVANAELDKNKTLKNLLDLPALKDKNITRVDNVEEAKPNFILKLKSFSLIDDAVISFRDGSVSPAYQRNVIVQKLMAGPFDSETPEQESMITLAGKSNRYAGFSFVAKAKPFLEKPSYKIEGDIKELSLPGLSSYIKQALQYEIESGQLDLNIDVQLAGTEIEGEVQMMLRGIELTAADDSETSSLNDQTSVPFNMALGMLKDSDGNVELSLPITGDTSSPDFGLSGFLTLLVKQATIIGARDYLLTTFVPFSQVVNVVVLAGEYALKVRINDLPYSPKEIDFQPEQQEFLKQFSALLKEHDSTQIKLCAIATAQDIGKKPGDDLTNVDDLKRLNAISMQRINIFKAYMIEEENIQSSRLLLCTPQIDSSIDAVSRLSFET
ncbi:MAG: DUF748 domain-containing protein [Oleispira sp.]